MDPIVTELIRARKSSGLSQQAVAEKAGISRRSLVSIEAGGDCTLSTLRELCSALGVRIEPKPSSVEAASGRAPHSFASAEEMSRQQEQRELLEALRVQAMLPYERARWLRDNWGALQRQAVSFRRGLDAIDVPAVRHFATLEEKNKYDEAREIEAALELALARGGM